MGVSEERVRSRMPAFSSLPAQIPDMISPGIGGALMTTILDIPISGATFFFAANAIA